MLDHADQGSLPLLVLITAVNGVAEELFFRGRGVRRDPGHPVRGPTVAYVAATLATGNVMLAFAAVVLGVVVGLERRASGGGPGADPHALRLVDSRCCYALPALF